LGRATALLLGPGFGLEKPTQLFLDRLLPSSPGSSRGELGFLPSPSQAATDLELPPVVMDADGLKLLARLPNWHARLPSPAVLTPHPGEMAVLTGLSTGELQADRLGTAQRFSGQWGHVLVWGSIYGHRAIGTSPSGGDPEGAQAGTGDVLAG
jgi:NAD(P)H-hydrate epimerase